MFIVGGGNPRPPPLNDSCALTFLFISLPSLHGCNLKLPNVTGKQTTTNFSLSFWTWIFFLGIQLQESLLTF